MKQLVGLIKTMLASWPQYKDDTVLFAIAVASCNLKHACFLYHYIYVHDSEKARVSIYIFFVCFFWSVFKSG
jgi:hypothetical protein